MQRRNYVLVSSKILYAWQLDGKLLTAEFANSILTQFFLLTSTPYSIPLKLKYGDDGSRPIYNSLFKWIISNSWNCYFHYIFSCLSVLHFIKGHILRKSVKYQYKLHILLIGILHIMILKKWIHLFHGRQMISVFHKYYNRPLNKTNN